MTQTLYDVLGVPRTAKNVDIGRAYNRLVREYQQETAPPDARRDALLVEAYETLTDEARRDAYDASLVVRRAKTGGKTVGMAAAVAVVAAGSVYFGLQALNAPKVVPDKPLVEIQSDASRAMGRVQSIDVSGKATNVGLAFGIADGVMASTCAGITPGAQVTVSLASRNAPVRITATHPDLGLCKMAIDGGGTWSLPISGAEAATGDKVYVPKMKANGEIALVEVQVKRIVTEPKARMIELSMAASPEQGGGPLIDRYGRVVGVANAEGRHLAFPKAWAAPDKARAQPVESAPAVATTPAPASPDAAKPVLPPGMAGKAPVEMSEERKKALREAFRPPPNVPDDL